MAGIHVFATGGIGGVHRGAETTMDISADLQELAHTSVAVVCAGRQEPAGHRPSTLEYLETMGVPVLGMGTEDFPAFYCRRSGCKAGLRRMRRPRPRWPRILRTKWDAGAQGRRASSATPSPRSTSMDFDEMEGVINARRWRPPRPRAVHGKDTTPFLLAQVKDLTDGVCLKPPTCSWRYNNARAAARIAIELSKLK